MQKIVSKPYEESKLPRMGRTTHDEARILLDKALQLIPNLNASGVGLSPPEKSPERATVLKEQQEKLRDALPAIALCADWISGLEPRQGINSKASSYGLKHAVERWTQRQQDSHYIPNGAFIAAAVGLGFQFEGDYNLWFNFKAESIKRMRLASSLTNPPSLAG